MDRERALVGDEVTVTVTMAAATRVERLEVLLVVPPGIEGADGARRALGCRRLPGRRRGAGPDRPADLPPLGRLLARGRPPAPDRFRLFTWERHLDRQAPLKVFPVPDALQALVTPAETQVSTGSHVAPQRGDGIEFADCGRSCPGTGPGRSTGGPPPAAAASWSTSATPSGPPTWSCSWTASDVRGPAGSTLDQAVGAAASLAAAYLRQRGPGRPGQLQRVRAVAPASESQTALLWLLDTLMETQVFATAAWKGIGTCRPGPCRPRP